MRRILAAASVIVLGFLVSVAFPAQAASGPWSTVSAGALHTCAINTGKSLYCWGYNDAGSVGDGTTSHRSSPTRIGSEGVWAAVTAGAFHTCAITTAKSLYCWGYNSDGQIGDGTTDIRLSPKRIGTTGVWAGASAGDAHTCAITTGSSLYCWGHNLWGQIGDGATSNRLSPKKIGATGAWAGATVGDFHTCAITPGESLYCWGYNGFGQVGDGTTTSPRLTPKKVGSSGAWALADAGDYHTCAISTGKSLYCWGRNVDGQIGDGTTTNRPSPKKIGTSGAWARVSAGGATSGSSHTCATTTGSSLYCWGSNGDGQIGDGTTTTPRLTPKKVGSTGVWAGSTAGGLHTCAISTGKSLYCWGSNVYGRIGDGTTTNRLSPTKVP